MSTPGPLAQGRAAHGGGGRRPPRAACAISPPPADAACLPALPIHPSRLPAAEMWIRMRRPPRRTVRALRALSGAALLVTLATTAGSIERLIASWGTFSLFGA